MFSDVMAGLWLVQARRMFSDVMAGLWLVHGWAGQDNVL